MLDPDLERRRRGTGNHVRFERVPTGARCDEGAGHLRAQLAHARRDGCTQTCVMFHEAHAPEDPRRFRSVDAIQGANDRLTDRVAESICAKTFAQRAEEKRVVLVPEHDVLLGREVAEEGPRGHRGCVGDLVDGGLLVPVLGEQAHRLLLHHLLSADAFA